MNAKEIDLIRYAIQRMDDDEETMEAAWEALRKLVNEAWCLHTDAERYRFLRTGRHWPGWSQCAETMRQIIDAAMKEGQK